MTAHIRQAHSGLTLIEVIISGALIVILLTSAAAVIINSEIVSSLARHRQQAVYVGQQILEQQRRLNFAAIVSVGSAPVTLDTRGTFNTVADDVLGNAIINATNIDANRKRVQVEINWLERVLSGGNITMREYFATTIANDSMLN